MTTTPPNAVVDQLHRRRCEAQRLAILDCGCTDPWTCRCTRHPLTERALDGWRDAARAVLAEGLKPLVPTEIRRSLWRRGSADRALAELLTAMIEEVAS